jgi:hypothetical protein
VSVHPQLWYLLTTFSCPSTSSALKTPENTEEHPNDSEPADERDIQMEYASDLLYRPSICKSYL